MRSKSWKRNLEIFLYDRQPRGQSFATARRSLQEVFQTLQGERKKK